MIKLSNVDTHFLTLHQLHTWFLLHQTKRNFIFSYKDLDKFKMEVVGMKECHSNIVNRICGLLNQRRLIKVEELKFLGIQKI